jgi:serine/threonine protein kinase
MIRILLHKERNDLSFRVRIPHRDDEYDRAYIDKVNDFFARHRLQQQNETIRPGPSGHVDLFGRGAQQITQRVEIASPTPQQQLSPTKRRTLPTKSGREWNGSGKYNRTGTIGKGAFAVVYKVTSKYDGLPYAAKELEKRRFIKNGVLDQKVENEMKIMQRVTHPNIVRYIEHYEWENRLLIIIMEFVPGGDLGKLISDGGAFSEDMSQTMSYQLLSALGYLHTNNITHRDVKPDNILINSLEPLEVKLTDFGLSKMVDSEQTFLRTFCGTLLYCAPEVYTEYAEYDENGFRVRGKRMRRPAGQRYSHAVDIWSLGGVIFYTLTGAPPYPVKSGISPSELLNRVMTTPLNVVPLRNQLVSEDGIDFIQRMLERRPEKRATVMELQSHAWQGSGGTIIEASQSYDEITDDEDFPLEPSQFQLMRRLEEDHVSDSQGEDDESEKENPDHMGSRPGPRLYGEVGVSAIGSSGAIPSRYLNLPSEDEDEDVNGMMAPHADDLSTEGTASPANGQTRRPPRHYTTAASLPNNQSADQLQSLVENVASQSLGESDLDQPAQASHFRSLSFDPRSSKRAIETSDEFDENTPPGKPTMKRLRSEGPTDVITHDLLEEMKLLAELPRIKRLGSGRQIDKPVDKQSYWEQDRRTWHLDYPEMTQLQHDAFCEAARKRGEEFGPGRTPLWNLAMKYFPPIYRPNLLQDTPTPQRALVVGLRRDDRKLADDVEFPPTAAPELPDSIPDTLPPSMAGLAAPQSNGRSGVRVAEFTSNPESYVKDICIPVKDSLTSFGRHSDNTQVFKPSSEPRVPKFAFKMLLWKDDYDPSKDPSKSPLPWNQDVGDEESYSFWISTKATLGIRINNYLLASVDAKNPSSPSQTWARLHHGDVLMIWGSPDANVSTTLTFDCKWGLSSRPRGADKRLEIASSALADKLDNACYRTERRLRDGVEKNRRVEEAKMEFAHRLSTVEKERASSRQFAQKIEESIRFFNGRPPQSLLARDH